MVILHIALLLDSQIYVHSLLANAGRVNDASEAMKNVLHHPRQLFGDKIIISNHLPIEMKRRFRKYL